MNDTLAQVERRTLAVSAEQPSYAGFWVRAGAFIVDSFIISIPLTILSIPLVGYNMFQIMPYMEQYNQTQTVSPEMASALFLFWGTMLLVQLISIVFFWLYFALFESSEKKCGFLRESCAALGLRAQVYHLRAEEAGRGKFRARFDVCCARAVARLNTLAEYCLPLVRRGGRFIAYKGRAEEELAEAASALRILGARVETLYSFELPEQAGERTVCVFEKYQDTPAAYPRGRGKERSKPL